MAKYYGRLYLTAEMNDEYSINPNWPDIGSLDITLGSTIGGVDYNWVLTSQYQVVDSPEGNIPYGSWITSGQNQQNLWDQFGGTINGAGGSILFSDDPIVTPVAAIKDKIIECGLRYNDETKQFYDYRTNNDVGSQYAIIPNPFIIGRNTISGQFLVLGFEYVKRGQGQNDRTLRVYLRTYTETRDADGNRLTWSYGSSQTVGPIFTGNYPDTSRGATDLSVVRPGTTEFGNICIASGRWGSTKGRFIIMGLNDSGEAQTPIDASNRNIGIAFISDSCFSAELVETPDYAPEPEGTGADGFSKADISKSGNDATTLKDANPYGLNNSQTGHVIVDKTGYYSLIGSIFGRNFNGNYSGTPNISDPNTQGQGYSPYEINEYYQGQGLLAPESYRSGETQSSTKSAGDSLGISREVREAMAQAILSVQIFPSVFAGSAGTISTIAGWSIKNSINCTEINPEIVTFDTSAVIQRPYGSFIGYEPYTTVSIFAPFIGVIDISPSVLFDADSSSGRYSAATVSLHYLIDSLTGLCSCEVRIGNPQYTYCVRQGCCSSTIPVIGSARSGEGAKSTIAGLASITTGIVSFMTGNVIGGATGITNGTMDLLRGEALGPMTVPVQGASNANLAALLSPRTPMWFMTYKNPAMPEPTEYGNILGGMTNKHGSVNSFSGYCEFYDANLSAVNATQAVKEQIIAKLRSGVII